METSIYSELKGIRCLGDILTVNATLPIVADASEYTEHLVQIGGHGVSPSLRQLRVIVGAVRLVHPAGRWVVVERNYVAFHRGEFQLQLPHEGAELPHKELQLRGLIRAGVAIFTTGADS